ncbi:MAG: nucleotidyltransferase family protein [Acidimicrobiales bacterium]
MEVLDELQAPTLRLLRAHRDEILCVASRRGVSNVRVFGSVARGEATPMSDIDLLVDFEIGHRGLELFASPARSRSYSDTMSKSGTDSTNWFARRWKRNWCRCERAR